MAGYKTWQSDGWYEGVLDVGIARLLVMQESDGSAWFCVEFGALRVKGGTVATVELAKAAALDALITQLDAWKEQAVKARVELGQQEEVQ